MAAKRTRNPVRRTIEKPSKYVENSIVSVVFYFALNENCCKKNMRFNTIHCIQVLHPLLHPFMQNKKLILLCTDKGYTSLPASNKVTLIVF